MREIVLYRLAELLGLISDVKRDADGTVVEYMQHSDGRYRMIMFSFLIALLVVCAVGQYMAVRYAQGSVRMVAPALCVLLFLYAGLVALNVAPCVDLQSHAGFHLKPLCGLGYGILALFPLAGTVAGGFVGRARRRALTASAVRDKV